MGEENVYYRSGDGTFVHRSGCSALNVAHSRALRWHLMEGRPFVEVMNMINDPRYPWLKACKRCMKARTPDA